MSSSILCLKKEKGFPLTNPPSKKKESILSRPPPNPILLFYIRQLKIRVASNLYIYIFNIIILLFIMEWLIFITN